MVSCFRHLHLNPLPTKGEEEEYRRELKAR
jgi:hypothetical protein